MHKKYHNTKQQVHVQTLDVLHPWDDVTNLADKYLVLRNVKQIRFRRSQYLEGP